jgi:Trk K+ transport system NAD-binding subunit
VHNTHVGVIGCGEWGQHIVRDLTMIGCEVTVVATSDASRARAESSGATSLLRSLQRQLQRTPKPSIR